MMLPRGKRWATAMLAALLFCTLSPARMAVAAPAQRVSIWNVSLTDGKPYYVNGENGARGAAFDRAPATGYHAYYNASSGELTLNGLNALDCYGNSGSGIYAEAGDLTLILRGTNAVSTKVTRPSDAAVYVTGALTIKGDGSLTAMAGDAQANVSNQAIFANSLTLESGSVHAVGGGRGNTVADCPWSGIFVYQSLTVTGGALTAEGGDGGSGSSYGIRAGSIHISGGAVTAIAGTGATIGAFDRQPSLAGYGSYLWRTSRTADFTSSSTPYTWDAGQTYVEICGGRVTAIAGYGGSVGGDYTVTADTGYVIDQLWVDGIEIPAASGLTSYRPQAAPAQSIFATFAYAVNFNSPANGSLTVARGGIPLSSGTIVRGGDVLAIMAAPSATYRLSALTVNGTAVQATNDTYSYTVGTQPTTTRYAGNARVLSRGADIAATFDQTITRTISVSANNPVFGSVSGGGPYNDGAPVTVIATANPNYCFVRWTENGGGVSASASYAFPATADRTLVAEFAATPPIQVIVTLSGSTSFPKGAAPSDAELLISANEPITATANYGSATLDGQPLRLGTVGAPGQDGSVTDGSIKVTVNRAKLNTLGVGNHVLVVALQGGNFAGKTAQAAISVTVPSRPQPPKTGDCALTLAVLGLLLSGAGLAASLALRRKRRNG